MANKTPSAGRIRTLRGPSTRRIANCDASFRLPTARSRLPPREGLGRRRPVSRPVEGDQGAARPKRDGSALGPRPQTFPFRTLRAVPRSPRGVCLARLCVDGPLRGDSGRLRGVCLAKPPLRSLHGKTGIPVGWFLERFCQFDNLCTLKNDFHCFKFGLFCVTRFEA